MNREIRGGEEGEMRGDEGGILEHKSSPKIDSF